MCSGPSAFRLVMGKAVCFLRKDFRCLGPQGCSCDVKELLRGLGYKIRTVLLEFGEISHSSECLPRDLWDSLVGPWSLMSIQVQ